MKIRKIASLITVLLLAAGILMPALAAQTVLGPGSEGDEVVRIQARLQELGYLDADPTGIYDEATEKAVTAFQRRNRLLATGLADEITVALLMSDQAAPERTETDNSIYVYEETEAMESGMAMPMATSMPLSMMKSTAAEAPWNTDWEFNTNEYALINENGFRSVLTSPLSTFAADVDTSSYAQLRRRILSGERVPADSVRIEEMLNYFAYDYARPSGDCPFGVTMEMARCPWNEKTFLLQVGLQAQDVAKENRPPCHLVFLIDTSGSMEGKDRLDLVKRAFLLLLDELDPKDTVSIVAYASMDTVVLEGVPAGEKTRIMEAINSLESHGYTNGSAGLIRAYDVAEKYRPEGGVTRILLATDGDLNVGVTSEADLARLVMEKKKSGIGLTCLGFGMGNYKDNKMEALADYGDGNCWYIDTIYEARKALITEGGGTFLTVAKDVKLQLDFNPALVKGYRLIGYEDRLLADEDFANDAVDGGEVGSGHRVTALYEIVPADSDFDFGGVESKYSVPAASGSDEWLTLSIRAKKPDSDTSDLYSFPLTSAPADTLSDNMKFAAAVAETGMLLRSSEWAGSSSWAGALSLLRDCGAVSGDPYKEEFLYMVTLLERADN